MFCTTLSLIGYIIVLWTAGGGGIHRPLAGKPQGRKPGPGAEYKAKVRQPCCMLLFRALVIDQLVWICVIMSAVSGSLNNSFIECTIIVELLQQNHRVFIPIQNKFIEVVKITLSMSMLIPTHPVKSPTPWSCNCSRVVEGGWRCEEEGQGGSLRLRAPRFHQP